MVLTLPADGALRRRLTAVGVGQNGTPAVSSGLDGILAEGCGRGEDHGVEGVDEKRLAVGAESLLRVVEHGQRIAETREGGCPLRR